jgi:hypothetical protein
MARRRSPRKAVPPDEGLPLGISPDGGRIHSEDQLPDLPLPQKVIVAKNVLHVDGWHIRFYPMGQTMMNWIDRLLVGWNKADPSPENHAQVIGVLDAMERSIKSTPNQPKQDEFDF